VLRELIPRSDYPTMAYRGDYRQWPFLTPEEFELVCAFFDQKYVKAKLGPTRKIFKIRLRRTATTGNSYLEISRLLQLPEEEEDLSLAFEKLNRGDDRIFGADIDMVTVSENADQVSDSFFPSVLETSSGYKISGWQVDTLDRKHFDLSCRINMVGPWTMMLFPSIACIHTSHM
jgi:hypothetical protein